MKNIILIHKKHFSYHSCPLFENKLHHLRYNAGGLKRFKCRVLSPGHSAAIENVSNCVVSARPTCLILTMPEHRDIITKVLLGHFVKRTGPICYHGNKIVSNSFILTCEQITRDPSWWFIFWRDFWAADPETTTHEQVNDMTPLWPHPFWHLCKPSAVVKTCWVRPCLCGCISIFLSTSCMSYIFSLSAHGVVLVLFFSSVHNLQQSRNNSIWSITVGGSWFVLGFVSLSLQTEQGKKMLYHY